MKKFAVSFKGGLAYGFGGLGVLKFFKENSIEPEIYAGSSAGAMVAAIGALNIDIDIAQSLLKKFKFYKILSLKSVIFGSSIVNLEIYKNLLLSLNNGKDVLIEDLPKKLVLFATDPVTAERVFIEKGSLIEGLIASASYPGIFPIIKVSAYKRELVDGDLSLSYSSNYLRDLGAEKVIGVRFRRGSIKGLINKNIFARTRLSLEVLSIEVERLNQLEESVDIEIKYDVGSKSVFDFKGIDYSISSAYEESKRLLHSIK